MPSPDDRLDGGTDIKTEEMEVDVDFEPVERRPRDRRMGRIVAMLVLFAVLSGGAWMVWGERLSGGGGENAPIIQADPSPIKIRPADPGGMDVPDRDKLVYDRLNGESAGSEVERLLPPPEEPLPPPDSAVDSAATAPQTDLASEQTTEQAADNSQPTSLEPVPLTAPESADPGLATAPPPPAPEPVTALPADSEPPAAPEITPVPEPAPATNTKTAAATPAPSGDSYRVQLAALRSQDRAEAEWQRLQGKHEDLLGALGMTVARVDLGEDKGVFFRLRAGPLDSASAAKSLCEKLAARDVGCLIVRPGM